MRGKNGSSLPGVLGGLTVLILAGVGLSALMEWRFHSSDGNREIRQEIQVNESTIEDLKNWRARLENEFDTGGRAARTHANDLRRMRTEVHEKAPRLTQLRLTAEGLQDECRESAASFERYRTAYRHHLREQAVGETLGVLDLVNGRRFTGVSIVRVTDGAMEIVHDAGRARISAKDLTPGWKARFQWEE